MSYILDALRKADAERDRGNVPGIHAQPSFGGIAPPNHQPAAKPWLWLAAGGLAVLIVGALAWYLTSPSRSAIEAAAPAPVAITQAPVAATPAAVPPPVVQAVEAPKPRPDPAPAIRKPRPAAPSASAGTAPDAKPAASGEKVYALSELPDDIRRQLPNVTVGGSMYSSKPADRLLIINGQVLHEGDRITPDLVLQQIRLKAALLNFKGYHYTIAF